LTAKELEAGKVGKTGKIDDICYQFATNFSNYSPQWAKGLIVQGQPKFSISAKEQSGLGIHYDTSAGGTHC
jgi:hypothetical protein